MDFRKPGILEIDGERVALRVLELDHRYDRNTLIKAELMPIFQESNARAKNKINSKIERVIFNDPATIVIWSDKTKTVVKCQEGDIYDKEKGLALCIAKKYLGNKGNYNEVFKKWISEEPIVNDVKEYEVAFDLESAWVDLENMIDEALDEGKMCGYDNPTSEEYHKYMIYELIKGRMENIKKYREV